MFTIPSGIFLLPGYLLRFLLNLCTIDITHITNANAEDLHGLRRVLNDY